MVWLAALEPAEQMEVNLPPPRRSLVPEATGPSKLHHVVKHTDAERRYEHLLNVGLGTLFKVQQADLLLLRKEGGKGVTSPSAGCAATDRGGGGGEGGCGEGSGDGEGRGVASGEVAGRGEARRRGGGGRRGGRRRRKERRRSAGCRERRGGVLSVCPCRHVCRQHLSCVHPAPVSPSSLSIAGHAPLGWTCRKRSGRPSSGPPRPPGSIRIRSVSSPAAVLRGRRPRARWARSAASLSCSVRSGRSSFTHVLASIVRMSWHQLMA